MSFKLSVLFSYELISKYVLLNFAVVVSVFKAEVEKPLKESWDEVNDKVEVVRS